MKVIILCGGLSGEAPTESDGFYGPMVDIGGKPVIWHTMNHLARYGHKDFILCFDFDRNPIKDYFLKYEIISRDFEIILGEPDSLRFLSEHNEKDWRITFVNIPPNNMSGSMVKRAKEYIGDEDFVVTYGDHLTTLDFTQLVESHHKNERCGTVVVVRSSVRCMNTLRGGKALAEFIDKSGYREEFISGGIFVFSQKVFDYFPAEGNYSLEDRLTTRLIRDNQLSLYAYNNYWQQVDSKREAEQLRNNAHVLGVRKKVSGPSLAMEGQVETFTE